MQDEQTGISCLPDRYLQRNRRAPFRQVPKLSGISPHRESKMVCRDHGHSQKESEDYRRGRNQCGESQVRYQTDRHIPDKV